MRYDIRPSTENDLSVLLSIENQSYSEPWSKQDFLEYDNDKSKIREVAVADGVIVGYLCYSIKKNYLLIDSLTVHPKYRRQGIASQFIEHLQKLLDKKYVKLLTYVSSKEEIPQEFFKAMNFTEIHDYTKTSSILKFGYFKEKHTSLAVKNRIEQYFKSKK